MIRIFFRPIDGLPPVNTFRGGMFHTIQNCFVFIIKKIIWCSKLTTGIKIVYNDYVLESPADEESFALLNEGRSLFDGFVELCKLRL